MVTLRCVRRGAALSFLTVVGASAIAQTIPPSVQPGAIERQLKSQTQTLPSTKIETPTPEGLSSPANATTFKVRLKTVNIVGATAFSAAELAPLYQGLIGHDATVADLYAVANAITAKYVASGYAISFAVVPKQTIEDGTAEIDVVEGYVAEFRFEGDTGNMPPILTEYAKHIMSSRPLTTTDLERFLLLANDVPGYTAKSVFDKIDGAPRGATRLIIHLQHNVIGGSATVDNRGSKAMGPWRADVSAALSNMLGQGEVLNLRAFVSSDTNELRYASANMSFPLGSNGTRLVVEGTYSDAHPGLVMLSQLGFASRGQTARMGIEHPLIRSRAENLQIDFFAAGQWLNSDLAATPNSRDHIYTLSTGGTYSRYDGAGMTSIAAHISQGLGIFDATTTRSLLRSRYTGSGVYTALNLSATRLQELGGNFEGSLSASGQLASRALLSSQECGYGGGVFGRGFDGSEMVGDVCALASMELRYNADFANAMALETLQFYGFGDTGFVDRRQILLPSERRSESAYSAGLGIRWRFNENLSGSLEYAQPFSRDVAQEDNRHGRLFFAITGGF